MNRRYFIKSLFVLPFIPLSSLPIKKKYEGGYLENIPLLSNGTSEVFVFDFQKEINKIVDIALEKWEYETINGLL